LQETRFKNTKLKQVNRSKEHEFENETLRELKIKLPQIKRSRDTLVEAKQITHRFLIKNTDPIIHKQNYYLKLTSNLN